ncbi:MgtC/SapB family protein [Szabonella alba]|uniref:Protein MgtC n=1 Tax=Szabonella alba TaxID=2804194 RepID=A0A8K0VGM4_9RHOB|nr:MgtC/SapB family protein [Szabonella alba]MBL4918700.1 MgtC/SapB family protein [Szabonella alba]
MWEQFIDAVPADFQGTFQAMHPLTALVRLIFAAGLGAVIGIERELHARTAGLRTHILIAIAACLFTLISLEIVATDDLPGGVQQSTDPLRLIEAVTAGVAFLAAGSIITSGGKVAGLTTGAGMWMAGAIGLACGTGRMPLAIMATVLAVVVLWLLRGVSRRIEALSTRDE